MLSSLLLTSCVRRPYCERDLWSDLMRRADRLFEIIQILRRRKLARAQDLAEKLEVSERTVYRDIRDLMASGVPIQGEAGVGYIMRGGYDLPPIMFDEEADGPRSKPRPIQTCS